MLPTNLHLRIPINVFARILQLDTLVQHGDYDIARPNTPPNNLSDIKIMWPVWLIFPTNLYLRIPIEIKNHRSV